MNAQKTYSIIEVSQKTGVSKFCIRDWHLRGFLPDVFTISVGSRQHRRFTGRDIQIIRKISEFQENGFTLSAAANLAKQELLQ